VLDRLKVTRGRRRSIAGLTVIGATLALTTFTVGRMVLGALCFVVIAWVLRRVLKRAQQLPEDAVELAIPLRHPVDPAVRACSRRRVLPVALTGPVAGLTRSYPDRLP
jgi:hypothetical protein